MPCDHPAAVPVTNGVRRDPADQPLMDFDGAYCGDCGAFRDASATCDAEPWEFPGLVMHAPEVPISLDAVQEAIARSADARSRP